MFFSPMSIPMSAELERYVSSLELRGIWQHHHSEGSKRGHLETGHQTVQLVRAASLFLAFKTLLLRLSLIL